ncbi:hypothetical protein [Virgibacillus salexigens]|uniref:hypothetical protein n=1 Tax=Virgibacillus massiliensis TaxID=1462526 RepID=UPI0013713EBF|nr:hypothetical protein [Virgibacillus massiliensis]MYL43953.1 hypothetical protein [Virgibacillus massiliensis]
MTTLQIEHDRLESFLKTYKGSSSMEYEITRLRELKTMLSPYTHENAETMPIAGTDEAITICHDCGREL